MWYSRNSVRSCTALLCIAAVVSCGLTENGQADEGKAGLKFAVRKANEAADARYEQSARFWRQKLNSLGSRKRMCRMAGDVISFDEKLAMGAELLQTSSSRPDRMLVSMRRHVVDERELARSMTTAFAELQQKLAAESGRLYVKVGVDRKKANTVIPLYGVHRTTWETAFSPLLSEARDLARRDVLRLGAVTAGSSVAAGLLTDAARQSGTWDVEENGFERLLGGLFAEMVVETLVDELSDPTEEVTDILCKQYAAGCRKLLDGPHGLLTAMRQVTSLHQRTRNQHFGITQSERRYR